MQLTQKLPRGAQPGMPANALWTVEACDVCKRLVIPRMHSNQTYAYCPTCRKAEPVIFEASNEFPGKYVRSQS